MAPTRSTAQPRALLRAVAALLAATALLAVAPLAAVPASAGPAAVEGPVPVLAAEPGQPAPWAPAARGTYRSTTRTIAYAGRADPQRQLDLVVPAGAAPGRPVVVLLHGGGYYRGDKASVRVLARTLASSGYVAVAANYRLSTRLDGAWPAQRDDLDQVLRWVRSHATRWRGDPTRIAVMGASAGGHLALFAGGREGVRAVVAWSPMLDPYDVAYVTRAGSGLAQSLIERTARCTYRQCPATWRRTLRPPGFDGGRRTVPVLAVNSTNELIDERPLLAYARRVRDRGGVLDVVLVPGSEHAAGRLYESIAWSATLAHLERYL